MGLPWERIIWKRSIFRFQGIMEEGFPKKLKEYLYSLERDQGVSGSKNHELLKDFSLFAKEGVNHSRITKIASNHSSTSLWL